MISDSNLETQTGWKYHLGGNIGGSAPVEFGIDQAFPAIGSRFYVSGVKGQYCDGEAYIERPWQKTTGKVNLQFDVMVDSNYFSNSQAIEFDTRFETPDGYDFNCSSQIVTANGKLQISDAKGGWADTGFIAGPLTQGVWHRFLYQYAFDSMKHLYGITSISIDGQTYYIPGNMQGLAGSKLNWTPGAILQVQLDVNSGGGSFSHFMKGISYIWE
jgi:hypothetical protein